MALNHARISLKRGLLCLGSNVDLKGLRGPLRKTVVAGVLKRPERENSMGDFLVLDNTELRAS